MMKRLLLFMVSSTMVLTMLAGCFATGVEVSSIDKVVKIGVFEPASGDSGAGGKQEILGMQYAQRETPTVKIGDDTYRVELVCSDNASSTEMAIPAAAKLVNEGVSIVLGSYGSAVSIAAGPTFGEAGLAAIGATCTNPGVTAGNDYYFRICFLDNFQGTALANFAKDKFSAKTAFLLGEKDNEYDQDLIKFFKQVFQENGGKVISESFATHNSDFTSYLNKAHEEGADVIFIPVSIAYSTQIINQAALLGINIPILGSDTLDNNQVLAATFDKDIRLYVSTFYQEGVSPEFDKGVKQWLNEDIVAKTNNGGDDTIGSATAMGYDAYYVAIEALKATGSTDPAAVRAALPGVTYEGVSGSIAFDEMGDAIRNTAYIKVADTKNGIWLLETSPNTK